MHWSHVAYPTAHIEMDIDDAPGVSVDAKPEIISISGSLDNAIRAAGELSNQRMQRGAGQAFGVLRNGADSWSLVGLGKRLGSGSAPVSASDPVSPTNPPLLGEGQTRWSLARLARPGAGVDVAITPIAPDLAAIVDGSQIQRF